MPAPLRFLPLFAVALAVRLGTVVLGSCLAVLPPDPFTDPATPTRFRGEMRSGAARPIEPWYRFDALWLANVGRNGYAAAEDSGGRLGVAFLPAAPAVFALADAVGVNPFWAVLLAANLAGAAGAAVLARVAARVTGDADVGPRAFVLLLAFPTAFFLSAPYNEAFGLLFTALAMAAWLDRKAVGSAVWAGLGSLARMTGVAVGVAAVAGWVCGDRTRAGFWRAAVVAAGSFAGLAAFWAYLGWAVGDPLAGLRSQAAWGRRGFSVWNPWHALESVWDPDVPHWGEAAVVVGFVVLGVRAWARRGAFWGVLALVPVGQMVMSGTFLSGHRLVLAALPAFVELADVLRNRLLFRTTVVGFAAAQLVLLNRYVHWVWAG
ncbi:MAG: hypothetical protein C0501_09710 [Isosphaera sp.]|nr:hypothetical protein [Isosphaera sp.]